MRPLTAPTIKTTQANNKLTFLVHPVAPYSIGFNITNFGDTRVNWGDGNTVTYSGGLTRIQIGHVYAQTGDYTVTITANPFPNSRLEIAPSGRNFFIATGPIPAWPLSSITSLFAGTSIATYPSDLFAYCGETVTAATYVFTESKVTTVPDNLLAPLTNVTNMTGMFKNCVQLTTVNNSLGLLPSLTDVTSFLDGAILLQTVSENLLTQCLNITTVKQFFCYCLNLLSIPNGFLRNNRAVTTFDSFAYSCPKLVINPYIFYNEGEQATRFSSVGSFVRFPLAFYLSDDDYAGSTLGIAPDLWNCTFPYSSIPSLCFSSIDLAARFSNAASIPAPWK